MPLHIKLVISYILVVGLALVPTAVYLRTSLQKEQVASVRQQLRADLTVLCGRLRSGSPAELAARAGAFRFSVLTRVTVMNASGDVLVDSERPDVSLPNHGDRAEYRDALARGEGSAERVSATTGRRMLYVARRCGDAGAQASVARLAVRLDGIESGRAKIEGVLRNAGAVALSAAVLLGLVAALVAVRPLRAIASAAHAIAKGDFGTSLSVHTGDEIEEVAHAINSVVDMLRDRLVASGAERATTQALLDELPVGVVVYDADRQPTRLNPAARLLCGLEPNVESVRCAELARLPGQRAAMERAAVEARGEPVALTLPWMPSARLRARWVRVYDDGGGDTAAVILADASIELALEERGARLREAASALRRVASSIADPIEATSLHRLADRCGEVASSGAPDAPLRVEALGALIDRAWSELGAVGGGRAVEVAGDGAVDVSVAERGERCLDALRSLLRWAAEPPGESGVELRVTHEGATVRVSARRPLGSDEPFFAARALRALSGDAGQRFGEDHEERWLSLPCA
ncbi:MAG: HAMP domain-containing protein [Polyangiales bacterium]